MLVLHSLFCVGRGYFNEGQGNLWDAKGKIVYGRLPALVNLPHLQLDCNAAFQGTSRMNFKIHVTSLSSPYCCNCNVTTNEVSTKEDEITRIVRPHGFAFVPEDVSCIVLEISPDGVSNPIVEVSSGSYGICTCWTSRAIECLSNWIQTCSSPRRNFFLHALSFECASKLCIYFSQPIFSQF